MDVKAPYQVFDVFDHADRTFEIKGFRSGELYILAAFYDNQPVTNGLGFKPNEASGLPRILAELRRQVEEGH